MFYGVEISHPVGEAGDDFHPHLNFLWRPRPGFRGFVDVELLRAEWGRILGARGAVDVYHQYSSSEGKIRHWCRYVSRLFPGFHGWTGNVKWYGTYPRKKTPAPGRCLRCGHQYRYVGTVSSEEHERACKSKLLLGVDPPWERDDWH
jgi:hypothetical protein